MSRAKYEPLDCYYRQDPLPFYSRPEYRIRRPLPDIPDHIMIWADSHSPSLDYTKEEVLRDTSAFPPFLPHLLSFNGLNEKQRRIVAEGLTLHVLQADQVAWHYYEEIVYDKQHLLSLRKKFFKIFATFALQIFDLEDFVKLVEKPMILKNVWEFCDCLEDTFGADNPEKVASKATTDISTGKINMEKYPFFWQTDADCILGCYRDKSHLNIEYVLDQVASTYHEDVIPILEPFHVHEHYITIALEALEDYKPLQEGKKLDLMLNADKRRCVLRQALYLEAWRGFVKDDLAGLYLGERGPHWEERFILSFHETLNNLAVMKAHLASSSEKNFRSLAECGTLGNFSKEVVEAVRIANFERMRLGYRFLTTGHLLFGLSRSRVADKIKVFEKTWVPTREVKEIHDTNLLYCILRHASNLANNLGLEEVLLEHLYLAIKFATRLLPTKKRRTLDNIKRLIDWNSIFQEVAITTSFLEEGTAAEPEIQSSSGEMSEEVFWGHFFKDHCMPGSPKIMFESLAKEFKDNNFKPLEICLNSTQNPNTMTDAMDSDGRIRFGDKQYVHLYSQYMFTFFAGCGMED